MQRFISMGLVALVAIPMTFGTVPCSTAEAGPLDKSIASDKTLLADTLAAEKEIRTASRNYLNAIQQGDGEAIAAFWATRGIYVDRQGQSFPAQALALREFPQPGLDEKRVSKGKGNRSPGKPGTIDFIMPDIALEQGTSTQQISDSGKILEVHFLAIWVKQDNRWLLGYVQETTGLQDTEGQIESSPGNLVELEWMVGQWVTQGEGPVAQLEVNWGENKKYLIQKFKVNLSDQTQFRGEQRIAWDPVRKAIRSWIFRADGGFAESSWNREGDTWIIKTQGVNASGAKTSAVNLWTPDGSDQCWCKSIRLPEGEASLDPSDQDEVILHFQRTRSGE